MAATKDWLLSEVEELISVWEGCRCLWGVTSKDYKDKQKKKNAMQEIATKFETTGFFSSHLVSVVVFQSRHLKLWQRPLQYIFFLSNHPCS